MVMITDWDSRPTRAELEADEAAERREREDSVPCVNCGEQRRFCTCTPPELWEEAEGEW
jgi:hypothetical protein